MKKSKVKKNVHEDTPSKQTAPVSSLNQTKYKRLLLVLVIATFAVFGAFLFFMTFIDGNGPIPKDIQITNITGTSATVVWTTDEKAYGVIAYSEADRWSPFVNSDKYNFAYDDRDVYASEDNKLHKYYTHHVTLNDLDPNKTYSYRVVYGQNPVSNTNYPSLTTGADLDIAGTPVVLQGAAIANFAYGNLSTDAFVTVTVKDFETNTESSVLSGVVDDSGRFSLDLRGARARDNSKVFEEIDPYDKVLLQVEGGVVQGEGSMTSIVANASSLPTILMLTKSDIASRKLVSSAYAMNDRTGDVLGESTCSDCKPCPNGYGAQDSQYCTCWRLSDDQSIEQTKNPGCNDSSQNETDQNNPEDPISTTGPSVEEVTRDGTGKYCQGNSLCTCSVVNGEVICDQCTDCGDDQTCNNNSAGKKAFCQDNEEDGSSTSPATGSGSKSTSTQPYQTSGQEPTVGESECTAGSVWYKSGEKNCDATNKWTVTISGKEIEYYPQVWQETVYQCVERTDGGTEWISFTKSGRLTGEACQGDEKNIEGLSEAEKKKIEDLKNSADVKEASQTFASTCNAGSYDYTEEKNGKTCTVHVVQGADCSWSLKSEDCGYSLTSQDVDPGSGGAESKPDPAVATKIANMMTEAQCNSLISEQEEGKQKDYHFLAHPEFPGFGYCYYDVGEPADSCDPLDSQSCEGVCVFNDLRGWKCIRPGKYESYNALVCNPFADQENDLCKEYDSVCLIKYHEAEPHWISECKEINPSFAKPIVTAKDLEDFLYIRPATPGLSADQLKTTAGIVEFRTSDKSVDYFKSVGLLSTEVKSVFNTVCHSERINANKVLCNTLWENQTIKEKYKIDEGYTIDASEVEYFGWANSTCNTPTTLESEAFADQGFSHLCYTPTPDSCVINGKSCSGDQICVSQVGSNNHHICKDKNDLPKDFVEVCDNTKKLGEQGCKDGQFCSYYGVCDNLYRLKSPPSVEGLGTENVDIPMVTADKCNVDGGEVFVSMQNDYGICVTREQGECEEEYVADGKILCGGTDFNEALSQFTIVNSSGEVVSKQPFFPAIKANTDGSETASCDKEGKLKIVTIDTSVGSDLVISSKGHNFLVCLPDYDTQEQSTSLNQSLMKSVAYAGGNRNEGPVLGASTGLPFEIIGGQLVLKNAGLYDLEMENKDIVAPKISVDAGIEEAKIEFYFDLNENGTKDPMEPTVDAGYLGLNVKRDTSSRTYDINKGWNLLAFPLLVKDNMKAKDVFESFSNANIQLEDLAVYRSGKWLVYSYDNLKGYFGTNFDIAQSEGFFVNAKNAGKYVLSGREYTTGVPIYFNQGWNLVGIAGNQNVYTGTSFLEALKGKEIEANQIIRWGNDSRFHSLVVNNGSVYGESEVRDLTDTEGYFVKVDSGEGVFQP